MSTIPISRVLQKLDEYLGRKDFDAAERHLKYWEEDARVSGDMRGLLTVTNEQIGFYRKIGREQDALTAAETAIKLAEELNLSDSVSMGTTLVNAATAYKAFGHADRAIPLYEKAKCLYEAKLAPNDGRLGGLYNNMALTLLDLRKFAEAEALFNKALSVMEQIPDGELEMAITWCNLADLYTATGEGRVKECLEKAFELLDKENLPRNGYYAFVCEKCANAFAYYGYPYCERELIKRARTIYERA